MSYTPQLCTRNGAALVDDDHSRGVPRGQGRHRGADRVGLGSSESAAYRARAEAVGVCVPGHVRDALHRKSVHGHCYNVCEAV